MSWVLLEEMCDRKMKWVRWVSGKAFEKFKNMNCAPRRSPQLAWRSKFMSWESGVISGNTSPGRIGPRAELASYCGISHPMRPVRPLFMLFVLCTVACGYKPVRYTGALPDVRSVAIIGLQNDTFEPGLDSLMTEALSREFIRRQALVVVNDPAAADLIIRGRVDSLRTVSMGFDSIQFSLEYQVSMSIELDIERRDGTSIHLDSRALQESELYLASADIEVARKNRREALRRVTSLIAERVHDALFESVESP